MEHSSTDDLLEVAFEGWTFVEEDHPLLETGVYATELRQIRNAQEVLASLSEDAIEPGELDEIRHIVAFNERRTYFGNWGVPLIVGLAGLLLMTTRDPAGGFFFVASSALYVFASFVPNYIVNRHLLVGNEYNDFGWIADRFLDDESSVMKGIGLLLMFVLLPYYAVINTYKHWGDRIRELLGQKLPSVQKTEPEAASVATEPAPELDINEMPEPAALARE